MCDAYPALTDSVNLAFFTSKHLAGKCEASSVQVQKQSGLHDNDLIGLCVQQESVLPLAIFDAPF